MPKKNVTMTDVARHIGVSISTVSRAINDSTSVREDLRKKILEAASDLGYSPVRSSIAHSKVHAAPTIAIIVPSIQGPFFANIICGIQATCFENGHLAVIFQSDHDPEKEIIHTEELLQQTNIKGALFVGTWTWELSEHIVKLHENGMPICLINRHVPNLTTDLVEVDKHQGSYEATSHLIRLGHTCIACVVGIPNAATESDHFKGYLRAMKEHSLDIDESLLLKVPFDPQGGYNAGHALLTRADAPTAIFVRADRLALGVLQAANDLGVSVPTDLSIVGHDDEPDAAFWVPALTTIRQPQYEMGTKAATLLFERIANKDLPQRQAIIQPQLIVRDSCQALSNIDHIIEEEIAHG